MNPPFQIAVREHPARMSLAMLDVQGEIDAVSSPKLEEAAAEAHRHGARYLLLDLSGVSFMGSAGLRALTVIDEMLRHQSAPAAGGDDPAAAIHSFKSPHLKLLGPAPAVARTLKISGFEMVFDIFSDRQAALDSFA